MKNIYIIGANNWQIWPVFLDFQQEGNVVPITLSSDTKDGKSSNFVLSCLHALELGVRGRSSFSYAHTVKYFELSYIRSLKKLMIYLLGRYSFSISQQPTRLENLLKFIYKKFYFKPIHALTKDDEIVFCSLMQSSLETDYFLSAQLCGAKTIYYPGNWDNPSSKLTCIAPKFDLGYYWTNSMKREMQKSQYFSVLKSRPHYRLNYINSEKPSDKKSLGSVNILIALSQKTKNTLDQLVKSLSRQLTDFPNYNIKIRLHPYNSSLPVNKSLCDRIEVMRPSVSEMNKVCFEHSRESYTEFESLYSRTLKNSDLVVVEGGTLALEALNYGKPVIVYSVERKNRTALVFNHFEHYRGITSCKGCIAIFDDFHLLKKCSELLETENVDVIDDLKILF